MFPTQSIPHNLKTNPAEDEANPAEDERGITLQTLIVTAVLVLMAVAAGVIVVAITNSASDDLEEQSPDLEARCAPWEIFDPELAAAGAGGGGKYTSFIFPDQANVHEAAPGKGGVSSSKVECLAVCYFELNDTEDDTLDEALAVLDEDGGTLTKPERSHLKFDTSNRPPERFEIRIGVTYARQKAADDIPRTELSRIGEWNRHQFGSGVPGRAVGKQQLGTRPIPRTEGSNLVVKVTTDQSACVVEDTSTGDIVFDPRN